jgi:riboflavin synthase
VFTGIVREIGRVASLDGDGPALRLEVEAPATAPGVAIGDSVSISGVCLTAVAIADGRIGFDVVPESLARTSLARLTAGDRVNVEPALRAGEPLGGHYVQGHVDGVGRIRALDREGESLRVTIEPPSELLRYCVEKGSVTVQGVSLTIAELHDDAFTVALIPHTLEVTTLGTVAIGDELNIEVDVLAKYVERLVSALQS